MELHQLRYFVAVAQLENFTRAAEKCFVAQPSLSQQIIKLERVILPDSTTLVDYLLQKTSNLIDTMFVYPARMKANLESTKGLVFSGQLLLDLVEHGVSREDAYRLVQGHAMRAWKEGLNFRDLVMHDRDIMERVPAKAIPRAFDLKRQLRYVDNIFDRVFGEHPAGERGVANKA